MGDIGIDGAGDRGYGVGTPPNGAKLRGEYVVSPTPPKLGYILLEVLLMRKRAPAITLRMVMLQMQGHTEAEMCVMTGYSPSGVGAILNSPDAEIIRREITSRVIDTMADIQSDIQALAPTMLQKKIELAMTAKSETVRNNAITDLLELAGHVPVKQVAIHRANPIDADYKDKTEKAIRDEIMAGLVDETTTPIQDEIKQLLH